MRLLGDVLDEPDETLSLTLSSPVGALLADGVAVGTILDDDPTPVIALSDASGVEGQSGWALQAFDVSLTGLSAATVSVSVATAPGSAAADPRFLRAP